MPDELTVALCLIATGKYRAFVPPLVESASRFFLPDCRRLFYLFSDVEPILNVPSRWFSVPHEPWPGPTIHRYVFILSALPTLSAADYIFYCDVDMRFVAPVGREILGNLVAVQHQGCVGKIPARLPYENQTTSRACVRPGEGIAYYAGGFQGGKATAYLLAMEAMRAAIEDDESRGIVARWHDESHWNRYLIDHPPNVILDPRYCCAEHWPLPGRKLLALNKNHAQLRK